MKESGTFGPAGDVMQNDEHDCEEPNAVKCGKMLGPGSPGFLVVRQNQVQSG
jgi:hypothetical protein